MTSAGIFECPVCYENRELRTVCVNQHGFCIDCIQRLVNYSDQAGQFSCPLCKEVVHVPPGGVTLFPVVPQLERQTPDRQLRVLSSRSISNPGQLTRRMSPESLPISRQIELMNNREELRNIQNQVRRRAQELEEAERQLNVGCAQINNRGYPRPSSRPTTAVRFLPLGRSDQSSSGRNPAQERQDEVLAIRLQQGEYLNTMATPQQPPAQRPPRPPMQQQQWGVVPGSHAHNVQWGGAWAPTANPPYWGNAYPPQRVVQVTSDAPFTQITLRPQGEVNVTTSTHAACNQAPAVGNHQCGHKSTSASGSGFPLAGNFGEGIGGGGLLEGLGEGLLEGLGEGLLEGLGEGLLGGLGGLLGGF